MDEDEDSDDDGDDDHDAEDNDDDEYRSKDKSDVDYIILPALAPQNQLVSIMKMVLVLDMLNIGRWMLGKRVEIFYQVKYVAGLDTEDKQLRCNDT